MGVDPVSLSIAGSVLTGAATAGGAMDQNRAIKKAIGSTVAANAETMNQIQTRTSIATQRYINDANRARGAIRVAAAAGGVNGADLAALVRQTAYDADLNKRIEAMNAGAAINRARSEARAQIQSLESRRRNVGIDAVQGMIQGAIAGYSLGEDPSPVAKVVETDLPYVNRNGVIQ
jgi:hypothetical protein